MTFYKRYEMNKRDKHNNVTYESKRKKKYEQEICLTRPQKLYIKQRKSFIYIFIGWKLECRKLGKTSRLLLAVFNLNTFTHSLTHS